MPLFESITTMLKGEWERKKGLNPTFVCSDRKMLHLPQLAPYQEVLTYMEQHNCKAEQESQQALLLMLDS